MKQYISVDQLNELSDIGIEALKAWGKDKDYNDGTWLTTYDLGSEVEDKFAPHGPLPLLSIGQMIEFLGDHTDGIYSYPVMEDDGGDKYLESKYINGNKIEELCDFLWAAVKDILEKTND